MKLVDRHAVAEIVAAIPAGTLRGKRDRALILLGFAGAFRRAELVALRLEDLAETPEGLRVTIRRSKTHQEGAGHEIPFPAARGWLAAAGITDSPVFRRLGKGGRVLAEALAPEAVADIVKARAAPIGIPRAWRATAHAPAS